MGGLLEGIGAAMGAMGGVAAGANQANKSIQENIAKENQEQKAIQDNELAKGREAARLELADKFERSRTADQNKFTSSENDKNRRTQENIHAMGKSERAGLLAAQTDEAKFKLDQAKQVAELKNRLIKAENLAKEDPATMQPVVDKLRSDLDLLLGNNAVRTTTEDPLTGEPKVVTKSSSYSNGSPSGKIKNASEYFGS